MTSTDRAQFMHQDMTAPASVAEVVVPDAAIDPTRGIYVGVAGDLVVVMWSGGNTVTFKNAAVGYHPIRVTKVTAASTTTNMLALY